MTVHSYGAGGEMRVALLSLFYNQLILKLLQIIVCATLFIPVPLAAPIEFSEPKPAYTVLSADIVRIALAHEIEVKETTPEPEPSFIDNLITKYALEYGVDSNVMRKVIECESEFDPNIQSGHYKNGIREESYGLAQINIPSHPHISIEQAKDPEFAIEFMAKHMSRGKYSMWSCHTLLKKRGSI